MKGIVNGRKETQPEEGRKILGARGEGFMTNGLLSSWGQEKN